MADSPRTRQRTKVGAIGLAIAVLLIVLASAILGSASRDRTAAAPGGAKPDIVANMAFGNTADPAVEPMDMGVSPGPQNASTSAR